MELLADDVLANGARGTAHRGPLRCRVFMTEREDGNLSCVQNEGAVDGVRHSLAPAPWTWLRQVHGDVVVTVNAPGDGAGAEADAAVTNVPGAVLSVQVADCVPVAILSDEGVIGVAHAGWKGLAAGVLASTVNAMRDLGACYEFGEPELSQLAEQFGSAVRSTTATGTPAMDMAAGVGSALAQLGIEDDGRTRDPRG